MLRFLRIEHLAVIDALEVEFEPGLNILTGETGAGKSMLVEAVGLLMGGRASPDLIRTGESQATVQAVFDVPADLKLSATASGVATGRATGSGSELIVRREITAQGRSRAFADDALVTATALKDLAAPLVELHGQHEHQTLLDPQSHLALLDDFAGFDRMRGSVREAFHEWKRLQSEFAGFQMDAREKAARLDLLRFQVAELEKADLKPGEDEQLETTRRVLSNADRLQRLCSEAYAALYDSDEAALARLSVVWKRVAELAEMDRAFQSHLEARDGIRSQLEELAFALRDFGGSIDASPAKLQAVEDRLAAVERLKRKYGPALEEVIAARERLSKQLDSLQYSDERRAGLESDVRAARDLFIDRATALSRRRRTAAAELALKLQQLLGELAMSRARFDMRFAPDTPESSWTEDGVDLAEWYFSANAGEDPRPLARIASGGELSRVMLAIRTHAAASAPGKTLIFDEIDAGIGGRVADVVGRKLRRLGESFQVLCITHLPQIAAAGHAHFQISKSVAQGRTQTRVTRLIQSERVEELARMIGGAAATDAARAAARELLTAQGAGRVQPASSEAKTKGESESARRAKAKER